MKNSNSNNNDEQVPILNKIFKSIIGYFNKEVINNEERWNKLFFSVFNNIVLLRLIYGYVRLYKKNENLRIDNKMELINYREREYIRKIKYVGKEVLSKGDLPIGVLKEVELESILRGDVIPHGVEIITFSPIRNYSITPFAELPTTIHTIYNAHVKLVPNSYIPLNLTSISFSECPNISGINKGGGFIKIPNTIKSLEFNNHWNNENITLVKGNIPQSVTRLALGKYQVRNLRKAILPNSIKELKIKCDNNFSTLLSNFNGDDDNYGKGLFDFTPSNVEILYIECIDYDILPESNLNILKSIKKLSIHFEESIIKRRIIENSLPPNITELNLSGITFPIEKNMIPNSVTNLKIHNSRYLISNYSVSRDAIPNNVTSLSINNIIYIPDVFPPSLTHLTLKESPLLFNIHNALKKMISLLPPSLSLVNVPFSFNQYNLQFPPSVEIIYTLEP